MAEKMKTIKNKGSVSAFLNSIEDEQKRKDSKELLKIFKEVTKMKPYMWGDAIVGFGDYEYSRKDGSKHEFFRTGFSPRKQNLTVYIMPSLSMYAAELKKIGKHKTSVSCLYFNKLADIDVSILKKMIKASLAEMKKRYG